MVAEADESDRSFLMLSPAIAVMTNIDYEHMEAYHGFEELQQAFVDFANKVPFYGSVVACVDDAAVEAIVPRLTRRVVTYGLANPAAHFAGDEVQVGSFGARCVVHGRLDSERVLLGELELAVPGRHNLQNALAAVAVADRVGIDFGTAAAALREFHGAERRFQRHGEFGGVLIVDDYGHHPTEIAAVLSAARAALGRRLVVAFQPHRYSRTQQLMEAFGPALKEADEIVLTDIYAASEDPIPGVTVEALADAIRRGSGRTVRLAKQLDEVVPELMRVVKKGDAVILLGAGSIGTVPQSLIDALAEGKERA
jgi:UDP-N-acetylmuramate--alanine ligase